MVSSLWIVIAFFIGAIAGRYLEKIVGFLQFMRKDLQRVQQQAGKNIPMYPMYRK